MNSLKYRISSLMKRVAELEQAESAEGLFFDNPLARSVRNLAESKAITNKLEVVEKVVQSGDMEKDDTLIESESVIAPPPPEEIVKKPGGKEFSTLNQFIVKTEEPIKGVPNSFDEIPKSEPITTKETDKTKVKKNLVKKVVERHIKKKDMAKAVKKVLQDKQQQGEVDGGNS